MTSKMTWHEYLNAFSAHFTKFLKSADNLLFVTDAKKEDLWNCYIESYQDENVRQSYNCNACRQFVKNFGALVYISADYKLQTIWNFKVNDLEFQSLNNRMHKLVLGSKIQDFFYWDSPNLGCKSNKQLLEGGNIIEWRHLHGNLTREFIKSTKSLIREIQSKERQQVGVFDRSLRELTIESVDTVLDLISQGSLYRGSQFKSLLESFRKHQITFNSLSAEAKDKYPWLFYKKYKMSIRNSSIGTLLVDISNGMDLDEAVRRYESIMAPTNYKRPKAIFTAKMVEEAKKTLEDLGMENSLARRHATLDDLRANNLLFLDRGNFKSQDVFNQLTAKAKVKTPSFNNVEEISLNDFVGKILPTAKHLKVYFEDRLQSKLVSLVTAVDPESPSMFKWNNKFSWSYKSGAADSIAEKVKKEGGNVRGHLRISLEWFTRTDLDLHLYTPGGKHIYYGDKYCYKTKAHLDVDKNVHGETETPVENIIIPYDGKLEAGTYTVSVVNYRDRADTENPFNVEIEYDNQIYSFSYTDPVKDEDRVEVAKFDYKPDTGIKFTKSLESSCSSREIWGLNTSKFHTVKAVCHSPNFWEGEKAGGNKHVFFLLEDCVNPDKVRGVFNEFLREDLVSNHKRVFEALGSLTAIEPVDNQMSGLGFSTTIRDHFICEVEGSFKRKLKVVV